MELKSGYTVRPTNSFGCSNRTFMELKLTESPGLSSWTKRSNRTFMELK